MLKPKLFVMAVVMILLSWCVNVNTYAFTGEELINQALKYENKNGGQCKEFIQKIIRELGVDLENGYKQCYLNIGIEINKEQAKRGDIVQISYDINPEFYPDIPDNPMHTAIILNNNSDGSFLVIDSNYYSIDPQRRKEIVHQHNGWKPRTTTNFSAHFYRLGEVILNTPQLIKFSDNSTIYYRNQVGNYYPILNEQTYIKLGFTTVKYGNTPDWNLVTEIDASQKSNFNIQSKIFPSIGTVVKIVDQVGNNTCKTRATNRDASTIYLFDGSNFRPIVSAEVYYNLGYSRDWSDIVEITQDLFNEYDEGYIINSVEDAFYLTLVNDKSIPRPINTYAKSITTQTVQLTITLPTGTSVDDQIGIYQNNVFLPTKHNLNSASVITISDLEPSGSYCFTSVIISGNKQSAPSDLACLTMPQADGTESAIDNNPDLSSTDLAGASYLISSLTKKGNEFQINETIAGDQSFGDISYLADGRKVAVWETNQGENETDIYAQIFDKSGKKQGAEFLVNENVVGKQSRPKTIGLINNNFVITWQSMDQDGDGWGIYAKIFNSNGGIVKTDFLVNSYTISHQMYPTLAKLISGGFVISWESSNQDGTPISIYAQVFGKNGDKVRNEFRVNSGSNGKQRLSSVAGLMNGNFVIVWQSEVGFQKNIYGQVFNSGEGGRVGGEFMANTYTTDWQVSANVAGILNGGFIITWQSSYQDGDGSGIYAQRFNNLGQKQGRESRVNSYSIGSQYAPHTSSLRDGGFFIVYNSNWEDGDSGVSGQRFDSAGQRVGGEMRVNINLSGSQSYPSVASFDAMFHNTEYAEGNAGTETVQLFNPNMFTVVWQSMGQDGNGWGIFGQSYDISGNAMMSVSGDSQSIVPLDWSYQSEQGDINYALGIISFNVFSPDLNKPWLYNWTKSLSIKKDKAYRVSFQAQVSEETRIVLVVNQSSFPWQEYSRRVEVLLTPGQSNYSVDVYSHDNNIVDGQIKMFCGYNSANLNFSSINIAEVDTSYETPPAVFGRAEVRKVGEKEFVNIVGFKNFRYQVSRYGLATAGLANGNFVIVWTNHYAREVYIQVYDRQGNKVSGQVNANRYGGHCDSPTVTALKSGGFVVGWCHFSYYGNPARVYGRRFYDNGSPRDGRFLVNSAERLNHNLYINATDDDGFVFSWMAGYPWNHRYYGQKFSAYNDKIGGEFTENIHSYRQDPNQEMINKLNVLGFSGLGQWAVSNGDNSFVKIWTEKSARGNINYDIFFKRYEIGLSLIEN